MRDLDWDHIRVFLAVARAGSLTKAAHFLGVSLPTVSRSLGDFEATLDGRLFDRLPTGLSLTDFGASVLQVAEQVESGVGALEQILSSPNARRKRPIRVTSIASVATFLARYLDADDLDEPPVEIASSGDNLSLARREADIALRMRRYPSDGEVFVKRLCTLRFALYGHADMAESPGPIVGFSRESYPSEQGAWLDSLSPAEPPFRFSDMWLRYEAVASGKGATILPCFVGDADPRLRRVLDAPGELDEEVFLLVHSDQRSSPEIRKAIDRLSRIFKRHQEALEGTLDHRRLRPSSSGIQE